MRDIKAPFTAFMLLCIAYVAMVSAAVALTSCGECADGGTILTEDAYDDLRPGDIVFRRGTGVVSHIVTTADIDGKYSHVGIVAMTDSGLVVVHAVPDEPDFPGDVDRVKAERPEHFFSKFRAQCGAVGRPIDTDAALQASRRAILAHERRVLFDHDFNDADTAQLYCCELITHVFAQEGVTITQTASHHLHLSGAIDANCTLPSDIYNSKHINIIHIFN